MNKLILSGVAVLTATLALPALAQDEHAGPQGPQGPQGPKGPRGPRPPMLDKMFEKLDVDNSGGVSLKEMQDEALARVQERFTKLDANNDGQVTKDEFKPPRGPRPGPGNRGDRKGPPEGEGAPDDAPDA